MQQQDSHPHLHSQVVSRQCGPQIQLEQHFSISFEYRLYQLLTNLEIIDLLGNELDPILNSYWNLFVAIRDNQKSAKNYIKLLNNNKCCTN